MDINICLLNSSCNVCNIGKYAFFLVSGRRVPNSRAWLLKRSEQEQTEDMDKRIVEAMEALQRQDSAIRVLFDAFPQMIWTALPDGQLDYVNAPFYAYTNWKPGGIPGDEWVDIIHEDDVVSGMERWSHSLQTGDPYEVEQRIRRAADGAYIWHLVRAAPVKDSQGEIIKWIGTSADIHQQKQVEEQLSSFVYLVSHDLKAPVNNIKAVLELFKTLPQKEWGQLQEFLNISTTRLEESLHEIVKQVTVSVKQEAEKEVHLARLLTEVLAMGLQDELDNKGGTIDTDFSHCPVVKGVASDLQVIFQILITNAIQYAHTVRKLKLKITSMREDDFVLLRFEDNGSGIDLQQYAEKLFMPFARFHGEKSGRGIGLYLLKSMLAKNGGKIELETTTEKGSSFLIYLKDCVLQA